MKPRNGKGSGPATLGDVAAAAGVAPSTVSRALSNPKRVNHVTRAAIVEAAERLGYTANIAGRRLRVGHSGMILLLMPPGNFPIVLNAVRGIEQELERRGYGLLVGHQSKMATTARRLFEQARGGLVDGILVLSIDLPEGNARDSIFTTKIPTVALLVDPGEHDLPCVTTNDRDAMYQATAHLFDLGHRHFFYLGGPEHDYHDLERFRGMADCLRDRGLAPDSVPVFHGDFLMPSGYRAAEAFLALPNRPTAAVCCSDTMAIGFLKKMREAELRIPEDVAVVGFDGLEFGQYSEPTLTTCRQPMDELGSVAARLLVDIVEGKAPSRRQKLVIESTLSIGGSTVRRSFTPE